MKNKLPVFVLALAVVVLFTGNAYSYTTTINDAIGDRIGSLVFELYRMEITQAGSSITFDIFTNFPSSGTTVSGWTTMPADLYITVGSNNYGVAFRDHDSFQRGKLYEVDEWYLSGYDRPSNNYVWNYNQPVSIKTASSEISSNSVVWNSTGSTNPTYRISTTLNRDDLMPGGFAGNMYVFYGGATCANDYVGGLVPIIPEPTTLSFLGFGLLGMVGLRKKRA